VLLLELELVIDRMVGMGCMVLRLGCGGCFGFGRCGLDFGFVLGVLS